MRPHELTLSVLEDHKSTLAKYHLAFYGEKNAFLAPDYQLSKQSA